MLTHLKLGVFCNAFLFLETTFTCGVSSTLKHSFSLLRSLSSDSLSYPPVSLSNSSLAKSLTPVSTGILSRSCPSPKESTSPTAVLRSLQCPRFFSTLLQHQLTEGQVKRANRSQNKNFLSCFSVSEPDNVFVLQKTNRLKRRQNKAIHLQGNIKTSNYNQQVDGGQRCRKLVSVYKLSLDGDRAHGEDEAMGTGVLEVKSVDDVRR